MSYEWKKYCGRAFSGPDTKRYGMSRPSFVTRTSPGYRLVVAALIRYSRDAQGVVGIQCERATKMLEAKRRDEADELIR
ncbi:hypothetical protein GGP41_000579 [Bipolaris sorokiniana]|uniref:Uncharacterized protein n=1 Tax=Cochliobolus sativus TaxID=45130 RepID=A0A8H5ZKE3_COCSA|nr:hypothetical protein GGP41_000579 [Bipolaris sorokiniana]